RLRVRLRRAAMACGTAVSRARQSPPESDAIEIFSHAARVGLVRLADRRRRAMIWEAEKLKDAILAGPLLSPVHAAAHGSQLQPYGRPALQTQGGGSVRARRQSHARLGRSRDRVSRTPRLYPLRVV